jgi:GrpB-like predicted nucleotidyltransferase (UPF0157 family)
MASPPPSASQSTDAPVELVAYDPAWPIRFEHEKTILARILSQWLAGDIEHIGSTAVPMLLAKPVIDIMAPVSSLELSRSAIPAVAAIGYLHSPYQAEVMHWFCKPSPACRTHHLHLVPLGSSLWQERLAFRNALRQDPSLVAEYGALKTQLAHQFRSDREAYTRAKAPFIAKVLARRS